MVTDSMQESQDYTRRRAGRVCDTELAPIDGVRVSSDFFELNKQFMVHGRVASTAIPTPTTVVMAAAPISAKTSLFGPPDTIETTTARIASDHDDPMAHSAPYTNAIRNELTRSPFSALS